MRKAKALIEPVAERPEQGLGPGRRANPPLEKHGDGSPSAPARIPGYDGNLLELTVAEIKSIEARVRKELYP